VKEVEQERPVTWKTRLLSGTAAGLVRLLGATVRMRTVREDDARALVEEHGGMILVTWHGRTLLPIWHFRGLGHLALISLSRDGDFMAQTFRRLGWSVVRGSTGRRAVLATRQVLAALEKPGAVLAFTPDGPRGPSRRAQPGAVYFAQKSGKPLVPCGISAYPRWQARSWDRYLVPKPFSRGLWLFGDPIFVGPGDDIEAVCRRVEAAIDALEAQAEAELGVPEHLRAEPAATPPAGPPTAGAAGPG